MYMNKTTQPLIKKSNGVPKDDGSGTKLEIYQEKQPRQTIKHREWERHVYIYICKLWEKIVQEQIQRK